MKRWELFQLFLAEEKFLKDIRELTGLSGVPEVYVTWNNNQILMEDRDWADTTPHILGAENATAKISTICHPKSLSLCQFFHLHQDRFHTAPPSSHFFFQTQVTASDWLALCHMPELWLQRIQRNCLLAREYRTNSKIFLNTGQIIKRCWVTTQIKMSTSPLESQITENWPKSSTQHKKTLKVEIMESQNEIL